MFFTTCNWCGYIYPQSKKAECPYCGFKKIELPKVNIKNEYPSDDRKQCPRCA